MKSFYLVYESRLDGNLGGNTRLGQQSKTLPQKRLKTSNVSRLHMFPCFATMKLLFQAEDFKRFKTSYVSVFCDIEVVVPNSEGGYILQDKVLHGPTLCCNL